MFKAKLRTKTGCFTCRQRRLKCNEGKPCCRNCDKSGLQCKWPSESDLYDRRHHCIRNGSMHPGSRAETTEKDGHRATLISGNGGSVKPIFPSNPSESISVNPSMKINLKTDLERRLRRHYSEKLIALLLLPNAMPGYNRDYEIHITNLVLHFDCVKYAVLACAASNRYMMANDEQCRKASFAYYTRAVKEVNNALFAFDPARESIGDAVLTAVIYMYIYALWGPEAENDATKHVAGAMQLLKLRFTDAISPLCMSRPFDRITLESVLYQSFLLCFRHPFAVNFHIDESFLADAESLLLSPPPYNDWQGASSPVLGAPLTLYQLILKVMHLFDPHRDPDPEALVQLKSEMRYWETAACEFHESDLYDGNSFATSSLTPIMKIYILAASLILDWNFAFRLGKDEGNLIDSADGTNFTTPPGWQLLRAVEILQRPSLHEIWTGCYLGSWPMLVFGYAAVEESDIRVIKHNLQVLRQRLGYGEIERILSELEAIWTERRKSGVRGEVIHLQGTRVQGFPWQVSLS